VPTLTVDYQWQLGSTLMGAGTTFLPAPPGVKGLGVPAPKTADVDLEGAPGSYAANDQPASRLLTLPMTITASTDALALTALATLSAAWAPSTTDVDLTIRLPGMGQFHVTGRPRGLTDDLTDVKSGIVRVLASFFCPDPTIHTP